MPNLSDGRNFDRSHNRKVASIVLGTATSDGAGVKLSRFIGTPELDMVDPFLLLDVFESDSPDDYIAGFPSHPHRGFSTVTYLLAGRLKHEDSKGHTGILRPGGVQWMMAGRGIVHSEMPEQENGLLKGFQLWINLPAAQKMVAPNYQEFEPEEIPAEKAEEGIEVKVIAGETTHGTIGPVKDQIADPLYLDIFLAENKTFYQPLPNSHGSFIYVNDGTVTVVGAQEEENQVITSGRLVVLGGGTQIELQGNESNNRLLLVAASPLREPVSRGGPFVMNTEEEVMQAYRDYRQGNFLN